MACDCSRWAAFRAVSDVRDTTHFRVANGELTEQVVGSREDYAGLLTEILGEDLGDDAATLWKGAAQRAAQRTTSAEDSA